MNNNNKSRVGEKMKTSVGEYGTQQALEKMKIPYKREIKLENLVSAKKTKLPTDFLIRVDDKVGMIEFNGRQHYHATSDWRKSLEEMGNTFNKQQKNDQRRRNYVFETGIPLLEIHFKDFDNIESIIKHFVGHIQSDCSQPETQYGEFSRGYFASIRKRKSPLYRKAWLLFFEEDKPIDQKKIALNEVDFKTNEVDKKFGYLLLDEGKILWTKDKFDKHIKEPSALRAQVEKLKKENRKLQSSNDKLKDNHIKEINTLQKEAEKLKEESKKIQNAHDKAENTYIEKLEEENRRLKASSEKRKNNHAKKTNVLEAQIEKLKEENKKLKTSNGKLKNRYIKETNVLETQIEKLEEENKRLESPIHFIQRLRPRFIKERKKG